MRTEKVNIAIYADASYFLMYRQVFFFDFAGSLGQSNYHVEWLRFCIQRLLRQSKPMPE